MRYLGVSRAETFSPNRVSGDDAIFRAVASELERNGHEVVCMSEHELAQTGLPANIDGIFQMARSREALTLLERADVPVTNTVQAVKNCARATQTELLSGLGLIPESVVCPTSGVPDGWHCFPCWIKRADSHAVESDDVQYVENAEQCALAMRGFAGRGLDTCVLQAHAKGWLVKFYGVRGAGLVDCYAAHATDGKFGLERFNEQRDCASVDVHALSAAAERASDLLGLDVYGGDAVIGSDGSVTIVDMNDWPSFRSCTVGAAQKIATFIINRSK
jgi:hypothetical protein